MSISTSLLEALLQALPQLRPQLYFKSSLTALSHAMEDRVLAGTEAPLVIASFQRERFYRQEAHRYLRIAERTQQVYVLAAPEAEFTNRSGQYETIAFSPTDTLSQEWHLIVLGERDATCLVCREREVSPLQVERPAEQPAMDQVRRFEGIWTFDRQVSCQAADWLLNRILSYRPELADKVQQARERYGIPVSSAPPTPSTTKRRTKTKPAAASPGLEPYTTQPDPFAERLVTYLQAGQYKLLKAYRSIAAQERKERLVNLITAAIRRSLNPDEIFKVATQELGQALQVCRCLIYRCKETDSSATIQYEFLGNSVDSLSGQTWLLQDNPLFQEVIERREKVYVESAHTDPRVTTHPSFKARVERWQICSWVMVPVLYQDRLLGILELHHCGCQIHRWGDDELDLVDAIATQVGVALIQAEAYANLEDLNQQLEALDRTRSNLVAITGHELRTPLSTIQVCLESLASEPDMVPEMRQVMLSTALADAERMRKLVQDFLTLSRLESGRVEWHVETLPIQECIDLALSSIKAHFTDGQLPQIVTDASQTLPLVRADGEWLVEVLSKLLDNACKFTDPDGQIQITAQRRGPRMMEVTVTDTGRGIEPNRLEAVFDRFYQEEGALRRSAGGTGLGLAICRQIITGLGGEIWAESAGKDQGSHFHFTIPIVEDGPVEKKPAPEEAKPKRSRAKTKT